MSGSSATRGSAFSSTSMVSQEAWSMYRGFTGMGSLYTFSARPFASVGVAQGLVGLMALAVEGVVLIVGPDAGHHARGDEGGHVVDVAVGLLGVDALLAPR